MKKLANISAFEQLGCGNSKLPNQIVFNVISPEFSCTLDEIDPNNLDTVKSKRKYKYGIEILTKSTDTSTAYIEEIASFYEVLCGLINTNSVAPNYLKNVKSLANKCDKTIQKLMDYKVKANDLLYNGMTESQKIAPQLEQEFVNLITLLKQNRDE